MRLIFLALATIFSWTAPAAERAEPTYAELLPAGTSLEQCGARIAANMIAAGAHPTVVASRFKCRAELLNLGQYNCTFRAREAASPAKTYAGNVEILFPSRRVKDPKTGAVTVVRYCRLAPSCLFLRAWPFKLRDQNRRVIQVESACYLNTDSAFDHFD